MKRAASSGQALRKPKRTLDEAERDEPDDHRAPRPEVAGDVPGGQRGGSVPAA